MDAAGENGIAYGVRGDNELVWQRLSFGTWGGWQMLGRRLGRLGALELVLQRDHELGLIEAVIGNDETITLLEGNDGGGQDHVQLRLGFFGTAPVDEQWALKARAVRIQERLGR